MAKFTATRNIVTVFSWLLMSMAAAAAAAPQTTPSLRKVAAALTRERLVFEENRGQDDVRTRFLFGAGTRSFAFHDTGVTLPSGGVELQVDGTSAGRPPYGERPLGLPGKDSASRTRREPVRHFEQLRYPHLYPGTDVIFHGGPDQLEFDAVLAAGADASAISFFFKGADSVSLTSVGDVDVTIGGRHAWVKKPLLYQEVRANGGRSQRRFVAGGFVEKPDGRIGFAVGQYDRSRTLIIDPVIEVGPIIGNTEARIAAASYLGGSDVESIDDIQLDSQRNVYVMGRTATADVDNSDFPHLQNYIVGNAPDQSSGNFCFLAKFDPTLSVLEDAVILHDYADGCEAMAVTPNRQNAAGPSWVTIVAHATTTQLDGFPVVKYVQQLSTDTGFAQVGITILDAFDAVTPVHGLQVDSAGNTYVLGDCETTLRTDQSDFPALPPGYRTTTTACTAPGDGRGESILLKLDPQLQPVYGTFIGGTPAVPDSVPARDTAWSLAIDGAGIAYVGGQTVSGDLPLTANAFSSSYTSPSQCSAGGSCGEAFLAAFDTTVSDVSSLAYATLFPTYSKIVALAAGTGGIEFASHGGGPIGCCASSFSNSSGGLNALIVGKLDRTLVGVQQMVFQVVTDDGNDQLLASDDHLQIIRFAHGESALVGMTNSAAAASLASTSTGVVQPLFTQASDACAGCAVPFLWTITADGSALDFTTFLDDTGLAKASRIVGDAGGNVYVATATPQADRATAGSYQREPSGQDDVLLLKVNGAVRAEQPVASIGAVATVVAYSSAGVSVTLNADSTYDPDPASPLTYSWGGPFLGASGTSVTRTFGAGTFVVPLTVTDSFGNTSSTSTLVTVDAGAAVGSEVAVTPLNTDSYAAFLDLTPVSLVFSTVTAQGPVNLTTRTDQSPPIPTGQELGSSPFYYDVSTGATYSGSVAICINLTGVSFADPADVRLYQLSGATWQDVTGSYDLASHKICGSTTQLGTFAVFHPAVAATLVTTVAGTGYREGSIDGPGGDLRDDFRDNVDATLTAINFTDSAVFDVAHGWLYIADSGDSRVRRVNLQSNIIDTIAGNGQVTTADPVDGIDARLSETSSVGGVALDRQGNLFLGDGHCRIRRVDNATNIITTVAGSAGPTADGHCFYSGDNSPATQTNIEFAGRLAFDTAGNLFFTQENTVRRIAAGADGLVTGTADELIVTVAGNGVEGLPTGSSVPPLSASIQPRSIAFNSQGDLYIGGVGLVSRLTAGTDGYIHGAADERLSSAIGCLCPLGLVPFGGDGSRASLADAGEVFGIAVDANGDVLLMDATDNRVRKVTAGASGVVTGAADEIISTVAGFTYSPGSSDATGFNGDGYAPSTSFQQPFDIVVDPRGGYLVLDSFNGRIRHFGTSGASASSISVTVNPASATVTASGQQQFSATVAGATNQAVTWAVLESEGGSISTTGIYSAPNAPGTFHVQATSVADPTKSATATVTVSPSSISVTVSPATATVVASSQQQFTATVAGTTNQAVTWTILESAGGSISAAGLYTAPNVPGSFHVQATSVADPTKSAAAIVTVSASSISVKVSPTTATVAMSGQQQFSATVTGTTNQAVTWAVLESTGGSISTGGLYTGPNVPGTFHVQATSAADPTKSAAAIVTVSASPISVRVSPTTAAVATSGQQQFSATVAGTTSQAVTWTVLESAGGSISAAGLYTAPNAPGTFHVQATSVADSTKSATATVSSFQPAPTLSPLSLVFGQQSDATPSAPQTVTLANPGAAPLAITRIAIGGPNAANFAQTNTCGTAIAASSTCTISVIFTPSAIGARSATLAVVDLAGTQGVTLSGSGFDPTPTFSPGSLTFSPVDVGSTSTTQTITMSNPGAKLLKVSQIFVGVSNTGSGGGAADYTVTSNCRPSIAAGSNCTINVIFKPAIAGPRSSQLTIVDTVGTQTVPLSGTGVDATPTASPTSLTFAQQDIGTASAVQTIIVSNPGVRNLPVKGFYTGNAAAGGGSADFSAKNNCGASIQAGTSCLISVTFTPTTAGTINSSVSLVTPLGMLSMPLGGTGVIANLTFAPESLTFAALDIGSTSAVQTITVSNPGVQNLPIKGFYVGVGGAGGGAGSANFTAKNNCGAGIKAGASCLISVTFTPTTAGAISSSVSLVTPLGTQSLPLNGTGVDGTPTFSPASLTFASQNIGTASAVQTITVSNPGLQNLPIKGFYVGVGGTGGGAGSANFTAKNNCGAGIKAGASCLISVTFTPTTAGVISSSVSLVTPLGTQSSALNGTGVDATLLSPSSLAFAAQDVGTISAVQTITVSNPGAQTITITGFYTGSVSGGSGDFAVTSNCKPSIAAGGSCVLNVIFKPTRVGTINSSVSIVSPLGTQTAPLSGTGVDGTPTFSPASLTFASLDVGSTSAVQTVTVSNPGAQNLPIKGFYVGGGGLGGGAGSANFTAKNNCGAGIAAGSSCLISVTFAPTTAGAISSSVSLVTPLGTQSVPLSGTGVDGTPIFSPASLTFAPQDIGTASAVQAITVSNPGLQNLPIKGFYVGSGGTGGGAGSSDFTAKNNCGAGIKAGSSCLISVTFTPTADGSISSSLSLVTALGTQSVPLSGSGVTASPTFSPASLTFASLDIGSTSAVQTITMSNPGVNPLKVSQIFLGASNSGSGGGGADFGVSNTCRPSIHAGGSCTIDVTFKPASAGSRSTSLTIVDQAGTQTVPLNGIGVDGTPTLSPASLAFAAQTVGTTSVVQTITVSNPGLKNLPIKGFYVGNSGTGGGVGPTDFTAKNNCGGAIKAGSSCLISVTFTPTSAGAISSSVSLVTALGTQSVPLNGTGSSPISQP